MTGGGEQDLSGKWSGIYNYPSLFPANSFEAELRDEGGIVTGIITQPREYFEGPGPPQQAVIEGRRDGGIVSFVKFYDDLNRPTPHYRGTVRPGGDEIEGQWTIEGHWSGTFLMIRGSRAGEAIERRISETV